MPALVQMSRLEAPMRLERNLRYTYTNEKFIVICKPRTLNDGVEDSVKYRYRKHRFLAAAILLYIGKIVIT